MRTNKTLRRLLAASLAIVMAIALAIPAFALEIPDDRPELEIIAGLYADWDGSYELPDLNELSPEDQEIIKAMVDEILISREAEAENTQAQDEVPLVTGFSDVNSSNGFYDAILWAAGKGIVGGYSDGTFRPTKPVTRAQFCVMLSRAFYPADVQKYNTKIYTDQGWFVPNTRALYANRVLTNTSFASSFSTASVMDREISRYDMAQLMVNIMAKKGFTATNAQKTAAQAKITDYKNIPSKYQNAVKTVYALGIIGGYGDGSFKGDVTMNRGQGAVVIYRMAKYTPAANTGTPGTDDGGKPTTGTGNTSTSTGSSGNTGSTGNSGSTGSTGNTGTVTKPETPVTKPETPAVKTLSNGQPVTEANVLKLLNELQAKYPTGTNFEKGYANGNFSKDVIKATDLSTLKGCGGWAALASDYIFGQTGFPARKVSFFDARPGDLVITLDDNGRQHHIMLAISKPQHDDECAFTELKATSAAPSKGVYQIEWGTPTVIYDDGFLAKNTQVWTRYPE